MRKKKLARRNYLESGRDFDVRETSNCLGVSAVHGVNECTTQQDVLQTRRRFKVAFKQPPPLEIIDRTCAFEEEKKEIACSKWLLKAQVFAQKPTGRSSLFESDAYSVGLGLGKALF